MIDSDKELSAVKEQIEYLKGCRDRVFERGGDPFMMHLSASGFEKKMRQLSDEVDEYQIRLRQRQEVKSEHPV